ncbi:MAG: SDR family NAD(P)-dependent oxidoreductase, partial [Ktedonobacteraceae bacterium]|nr:SDR family NAD(P)-dependent oxidoreductase [Ktedonobacteraceae bacterium]
LEALEGIAPHVGQVAFYSTVRAEPMSGSELDAAYWMENLRQPVRFAQTVEKLVEQGYQTFVEISAHPLLVQAVEEELHRQGKRGCVVRSLRREEEEGDTLRQQLGQLYVQGVQPCWQEVLPAGRLIQLPTYPWQREHFWFEPQKKDSKREKRFTSRAGLKADLPLLGGHFAPSNQPGVHYWEVELDAGEYPYLSQHRVQGVGVIGEALLLEMVLEAAHEVLDISAYRLDQVELYERLRFDHEGKRRLQLMLSEQSVGVASFELFSYRLDEDTKDDMGEQVNPWQLVMSGSVQIAELATPSPVSRDRAKLEATAEQGMQGEAVYTDLQQQQGLDYGPWLQSIEQLWQKDGATVARLRLPSAAIRNAVPYQVHPALLTACLQVIESALKPEGMQSSQKGSYVLACFDQFLLYYRPEPLAREFLGYMHVRDREDEADTAFTVDFLLLDSQREPVCEIKGARLRYVVLKEEPQQAQDEFEEWFYRINWEALSLPTPPVFSGNWLIFADQLGVGERLSEQIRRSGGEVTVISHEKIPHSELAEQVEAFSLLVRQAWGRKEEPSRQLIYLGALRPALSDEETVQDVEQDVEREMMRVLALVQSLAQAGWRNPPRLWFITQGAQDVTVADKAGGQVSSSLDARQSMLWGFVRSLVHEQPSWSCSLVDLMPGCNETDLERLGLLIAARLEENQYILRATQIFAARLARYHVPEEKPGESSRIPIRADGSYLIVGGLKGVGLSIAEGLTMQGARYLALMGRSPASQETQLQLMQWRAQGVQVLEVQADVANEQQLATGLEMIREQFPPLRGIIHSAAVLHDAIFLNLSAEQVRPVLAPKVAGGWGLHLLTREERLDFFIFFSGGASLLGSPGQVNYAGANGFVDGLAAYRRQQGLPALSINWGPWAQVGLAAQQEQVGQRLALQGMMNIQPRQGQMAFARLLTKDAPSQVGVFPLNVRQLQQASAALARAPFFTYLRTEQESQQTRSSQWLEQLKEVSEQERRLLIEGQIREQVAQVLRLPPGRVNAGISFQTQGMDSLMALEIRNRLEDRFALTLSATILWSYPTLETLTGHLTSQMGVLAERESSQKDATTKESIATTKEALQPSADLEKLSTNEIANLLAQKLANIRKSS